MSGVSFMDRASPGFSFAALPSVRGRSASAQHAMALAVVAFALTLGWVSGVATKGLYFMPLLLALLPLTFLVRPGAFLAAAFVGLAVTWYVFLPPQFSFEVHTGENLAAALMFVAAVMLAAIAGFHCDRMQQARFLDQERLRQSEADALLLQRLSIELTQQNDLTAVYQRFIHGAAAIMRSQFASMQMLYPDRGRRGELRLLGQIGFSPEAARFWEWVGVDSACTCGHAFRTDARVIVSDVQSSPLTAGTSHLATYLATGILAVQSTPLRSRDGRLLGMISTHWDHPHQPAESDLRNLDILARLAADLIERRLAEEERDRLLESERAARAEAETAARTKDEFLATLSHELRTPLSAIIGWMSIIEKRPGDPKILADGLPVIARNARAQARLITDLLDMSRILAGKIQIERRPVDLTEVIHHAVQSLQLSAEEKKVLIETVFEPIEGVVRGDPARLQQIVGNLLSNAVKFTSERGRIRVHLRRQAHFAQISVSDNGAGIAPKFLPHVFDKFRQADGTSNRRHGGLGLGLTIVKHLVQLHGGAVSVQSPGADLGSTFTVQLPLTTETAHAGGVGTPEDRPGESDEFDLTGVKIVAVDDHRDSAALVQRLLEDCQAQVCLAGSAQEAVRLILDEQPDVILCDLGMPGRDGYQFIRDLRASGDDTPAIALTAFVRPEDKERAAQAGFNAHLCKPLNPQDLLATVARFARVASLR